MNKKIAILGANGQLGSDFVKVFSLDPFYIVHPLTHKDIEITDTHSVLATLDSINPDIVINPAAYTKVDEAEEYPQRAFEANSIGTKNLAQYCKKNGITFVYISSDYVFGGDQQRKIPYTEDDCPEPLSTYGISKLAGELYVKALLSKYFIIRTTGLFGITRASGKGYNFIELMLRLAKESPNVKVVNDQIMTPTYTLELSQQILELLKTDKFGIYHITAEGQCSWYDFAKEIFKLTNTKTSLISVPTSAFPTPAHRPSYSVLENKKLKELGINRMKEWKEELIDYLKEKKLI